MPISPKKGLNDLAPAQHGSLDYAELESLGIAPEEIIDFSVCTNPFGPPLSIRDALAGVAIGRYPDSEATALRRALAKYLGVGPENILVGSGSTELIRLAAQAYFNPKDIVIIPMPNFGEYEVACRLCGARLVMPYSAPENGFKLKIDEIVGLIRFYHPKGLFLSNPNNPTGQLIPQKELEAILQASANCLIIADEAYIAFVDGAWPSQSLIAYDNLLILRSMTKDYALAGLRLGYAIANSEIISNLRRARPPWNVNSLAQQAGLLALKDERFLAESLKQLRQERDSLVAKLEILGLKVVPTQANFFLVKVGNARAFREKLLKRKILVRDCTSFGLPEYIRLAPRTPPENEKLVDTIQELIPHGLFPSP